MLREFSFSQEEAESAAKAELGTGDLPGKMSMGLLIMMVAIVIVRMIMDLPLPSFRVLGSYIAAATAWVGFLLFIHFRVKNLGRDLTSQRFYLEWGAEGIAAGRYHDEMFYHTGWKDIQLVEQGPWIYRITSPAGRLSFPKSILTAEERAFLDSLTAEQKKHTWM